MILRNMGIDDYEMVHSLWLSTPGMGLNDLDDSKNGIRKFLKRNPNTCFVAECDDRIVGVILAGHDGRRGVIYHTAVANKMQRKGIGTSLVDSVMVALENEGIHKVFLVVFDRNIKGNEFWENLGFEKRDDLIYRNKLISELKRIDT